LIFQIKYFWIADVSILVILYYQYRNELQIFKINLIDSAGIRKTNNKIEVVPLGLMRGRNFHNAFIVADECQNASYDQLKMLLTRIGNHSKMILTGDVSQSDLNRHMQGGFYNMLSALTGIEGIGVSLLNNSDIVRNPIIGKIISRLDSYENETGK
jgi:phosphate starvation-inducible PhoH-like protein